MNGREFLEMYGIDEKIGENEAIEQNKAELKALGFTKDDWEKAPFDEMILGRMLEETIIPANVKLCEFFLNKEGFFEQDEYLVYLFKVWDVDMVKEHGVGR